MAQRITIAASDLAALTQRDLPVHKFDAGEPVFFEDDVGDHLYVVVTGAINVITYGQALEDVGPGGIFGEIALIDAGSRSASAMAAVDSETLRIDRAAFLELVREQPTFALDVMRTLAARLRRATGDLPDDRAQRDPSDPTPSA